MRLCNFVREVDLPPSYAGPYGHARSGWLSLGHGTPLASSAANDSAPNTPTAFFINWLFQSAI